MYFCIILERKQVVKMLQFELKKVFSKFKNRMAIVLLLVILVAVSMLTMNRVEYVDSDGNHVSGLIGARSLRAEKNKWKGEVTEDVLEAVVRENEAVNHSPEFQSDNIEELDEAYARKQGFSGIAEIINNAFSEWRDYDYFAIDNVSSEEAKSVYARRISNLKQFLDSGEEVFSDSQKEYMIKKYEDLETPFYYEYTDGWSALLQNISTFILVLALIIGFLVSGIFSSEFQTKADAIFFSTKLGRNRAVLSKMGAGFLITTVFYVAFVLLYTFVVLLALGADGANCPIQMDMWRSVYNVTFLQAYLLIVAGGYVGTLFAATLSMLASAITRSTATAIIVPFIVLCAFPFLSRVITLPGICSYFPDQLLEIYITMKDCVLVELGGEVVDVVSVIVPVYAAVCLLLEPVLYKVYKRTQVS
jgi:ABC-type transport system involved in multi-copper enzyme maturation permease subunit